jgi:5-methyltetrahydropteroyltriglutamate--homocysteine methyltransferase
MAYVSDPAEFERELRALDVPAGKVRHPAVFGPLSRRRPLAVHELEFLRRETARPIKVALPGPYLLTRTMWMECVSDRAYANREALARDIVRVLREELHCLLAGGAALVQLDEPILSEVVFGGSVTGNRTFMCGVLDARGEAGAELAFAEGLWQELCAGLPRERLGLHLCRGNWTPDEAVALSGDYRPLLPTLSRAPVGTLFLELATPRAGELEVLAALPGDKRIGVGVINQKRPEVEPVEVVLARAEAAVQLFGVERVLLNTDCGFATFADNPIASARLAQAMLATLAAAARTLRQRHGLA